MEAFFDVDDIGVSHYLKACRIFELWMNNYPRKILGYKTANHIAS